jgi:hypothetical protein
MKYALVSPNEPVTNWDGSTGYRIAEVAPTPFEVAKPLFWDDCDDACVADLWYYNIELSESIPKPIEPEPVPPEPV